MKGRELDNIDKYLLGEMDADELLVFKKTLATDVDLQRDVQIRKAIHHEINEEYRQELKAKLIQHDKELQPKNWLTPIIRFAAVSLIVLVGIYTTYQNYYKIDVSKYDFYEEGINNYMNDDTGMVLFNNAMSKFRSEDYNYAAPAFEKLLLTKPTNDTINYYLGVAYYRENAFDKSIARIKSVLSNKRSVYYQKAEFRLGLAYYADDHIKEAKLTFEKIANADTHIFYAEAKEILDNW